MNKLKDMSRPGTDKLRHYMVDPERELCQGENSIGNSSAISSLRKMVGSYVSVVEGAEKSILNYFGGLVWMYQTVSP